MSNNSNSNSTRDQQLQKIALDHLFIATLETRSSDSLLESKANISLSTGSNIRSGQTNVVAVNGTLYLMGKLTQRETDRAIVRLQALDGVKRIVKIVDILPEQASDAPST